MNTFGPDGRAIDHRTGRILPGRPVTITDINTDEPVETFTADGEPMTVVTTSQGVVPQFWADARIVLVAVPGGEPVALVAHQIVGGAVDQVALDEAVADLATTADVDGVSTDLAGHADATKDVHGIADTAELVTSDGLQGALDGKQDAGDYADAGHDHDDRYVRTVNNTGPDQDGNVAVEGDVTIDTSVGTRVFIGPVMVYGDTGWRELDVPELTAGTLAIRRTGDVVSLQLDGGVFDSSSFTIALPRLPVSFRPANRVRDMWLPNQSAFPVGTINCSVGGYLNLYSYSEGTAAYFSVRYDTASAWPATLPGSPS